MPFEKAKDKQQFHRARIRAVSTFVKNGLRNRQTFALKSFGKGIYALIGKLKKTGKTAVQALRFDKKKFTPEEARKWVREHRAEL